MRRVVGHGAGGGSQAAGGRAVPMGDSGGAEGERAPPVPAARENRAPPDRIRPAGSGQPTTGKAVPRGAVPPAGGGGTVFVPGYGYGFYPWGFGGLGFAGAYYGGYYDPWYGAGPSYPIGGYSSSDQGAIRLKVKPREAQVYVDGYYAGNVDDFDGVFQRLHLGTGRTTSRCARLDTKR